MNETSTTTKRLRKKHASLAPKIIVAVLVIAATGILYMWQKGDIQPDKITAKIRSYIDASNKQDEAQVAEHAQEPEATAEVDPGIKDESGGNSQFESLDATGQVQPGQSTAATGEEKNGDIVKTDDESTTGSVAGNGADSSGEKLAATRIKELNDFYAHLDKQQYMKPFNLPEPSKIYFSKLIQKLLDNPPVVNRETDDLFTLLKNTAHFFRVLGKENIIILKGILDREKDSFEQILQTFYALTDQPQYLEKEYGIVLSEGALHDYAGFFLNTMGGRLYLFRRDSLSRLTVSYYSILIIDRAISNGNGRHGIDLRPAIDSLIEELENGGDRLQLKDTYLNTLYDLQQKYTR